MKLTLVILAAGLGSRFGGLKQFEAVGPEEATILDYSIYDAFKAGFQEVVFIIQDSSYVKDSILDNKNMSLLSRLTWLKRNQTFLNKYYDTHRNQLNELDDNAFYRYIMDASENKTPQSIIELQSKVWGYSFDLETHTVETHIYRLRKKIKDKFNDENFIISHDEGYLV